MPGFEISTKLKIDKASKKFNNVLEFQKGRGKKVDNRSNKEGLINYRCFVWSIIK